MNPQISYELWQGDDFFWAYISSKLPTFPLVFSGEFFAEKKNDLSKDEFIAKIKEEFHNTEVSELEGFFETINMINENFNIIIRKSSKTGKYAGYVMVKDLHSESTTKLNAILAKSANGDICNDLAELHYYYLNPHGNDVEYNTTYKDASDFGSVLETTYPWINVRKMVKAFLSSDENILILTWDAWVGKTSFVKYVIRTFIENNTEEDDGINVAYCKDEKLVKSDLFWTNLLSNEYHLLVLDDFDEGLNPREENSKEENTFVSKLLSFSDGIFENKVKIIITTNKKISEIDSAIVRPGRCFDILKMRKLKKSEARVIWTDSLKHDVETFEEIFGDTEEIAQALLMSESKKLNVVDKDYLTEPELSVRKEFEQSYKKIKCWFDVDGI